MFYLLSANAIKVWNRWNRKTSAKSLRPWFRCGDFAILSDLTLTLRALDKVFFKKTSGPTCTTYLSEIQKQSREWVKYLFLASGVCWFEVAGCALLSIAVTRIWWAHSQSMWVQSWAKNKINASELQQRFCKMRGVWCDTKRCKQHSSWSGVCSACGQEPCWIILSEFDPHFLLTWILSALQLYIGLGLSNITAFATTSSSPCHHRAVVHVKHIDNIIIRWGVDDFAFEYTHNYVQIAKIERFVQASS